MSDLSADIRQFDQLIDQCSFANRVNKCNNQINLARALVFGICTGK
jgi:hypothetical protein